MYNVYASLLNFHDAFKVGKAHTVLQVYRLQPWTLDPTAYKFKSREQVKYMYCSGLLEI